MLIAATIATVLAAAALSGCTSGSGTPAAAGSATPTTPTGSASTAGGSPASSVPVSVSGPSGNGQQGSLVAQYDGFVLKSGNGIVLGPGGTPKQNTVGGAGPDFVPNLVFNGSRRFTDPNGDALYGAGSVSFQGCVVTALIPTSGLGESSAVPAGQNFCFAPVGPSRSGVSGPGLVGLIQVVGYQTSTGAPDPDPAGDGGGAAVINVSIWKLADYHCADAPTQTTTQGAHDATYPNVVLPAGDQVVLQTDVVPDPAPECATYGYDLGYDGNGAFSSTSQGLLKLDGSTYQSCEAWADDVNAALANSVAGLEAGDTLCYSGGGLHGQVKVDSVAPASATIDIATQHIGD